MSHFKMSKEYIQGIFDGEGCLDINEQKRTTKNNKVVKYYYVRSNIANKNVECLREIRDFLGYGKIYYRPNSQVYILNFNEKETIKLVGEIKDGLIVKKEEARLIESFIKSKEETYYIELKNRRRGYKAV